MNLLISPSVATIVTALFVGMYIRRVESVFQDVGDRFGDTLKGILGSAVQRLSPEEKQKQRQELQIQFLALKEIYEKLKVKLDASEYQKLDDEFKTIKNLIQKGKVIAAKHKFLSLEFQIRNFQILHPEE